MKHFLSGSKETVLPQVLCLHETIQFTQKDHVSGIQEQTVRIVEGFVKVCMAEGRKDFALGVVKGVMNVVW